MALKIRLARGGSKKHPFYRIVVAEASSPRDGRFVERLGSYDPMVAKDHQNRVTLNNERITYWMSKGAQPTLRVSRILGEMQLMPMPKPGNNPLKAIPKKDRKKEEKKEEPKAEAKKEEPKGDGKKEEPKAEAKKEEPKKAEAKKEEPKA